MDIKVIGRKVAVTEALHDYAIEKVGSATKVINVEIPEVEVVLRVEKTRAIPCICEVTLRLKGHTIHVEEHEEDMYAAIDVAAAKVLRQLRKYKTRVIDHRMRETLKDAAPAEAGQTDFDELMAELSADDEVVRVKEIEFEPMTEQDALIQIDLLGHDFFVYTDRDSNEVNVLYRRKDGGYGLLKPKAE
ncbi:MAG: ribosome-associated translation inhibitor RaiA [Slackia sp.]|nr:ribosome-associated translation inhibitor RaiA [Slackia sp.]